MYLLITLQDVVLMLIGVYPQGRLYLRRIFKSANGVAPMSSFLSFVTFSIGCPIPSFIGQKTNCFLRIRLNKEIFSLITCNIKLSQGRRHCIFGVICTIAWFSAITLANESKNLVLLYDWPNTDTPIGHQHKNKTL